MLPSALAMATAGTTIAGASQSTEENGRSSPAPAAAQIPTVGRFLGRHRLSATISRLEQEIRSLETELEELDAMEPSSAACRDVLASMIGMPDALLPSTNVPENSSWERWFQPVRSPRSRAWWNYRAADLS